jgi:hypothetical protein
MEIIQVTANSIVENALRMSGDIYAIYKRNTRVINKGEH